MSQQIEIEYKTLLSENHFLLLLNHLPFPQNPVKQINHYFETEDFSLKNERAALRIREKNGQYELTLKEPHKEVILETTDVLTKEQFHAWMNEQPPEQGAVVKQLNKLNISLSALRYFGQLTTERRTYCEQNIYYMLDKSYYHDNIDFELEIESPSQQSGLEAMEFLLNQFNIPLTKAKPKIQRFFEAK